jgi:hypothetical protein
MVVAVGLGASHAAAGSRRSGNEVQIYGNEHDGAANGQLATVRNSDDDVQYIGCVVGSNGLGQPRSVSCEAMNAKGQWGHCSSSDPEKIAVLDALQLNSQLSFAWNKTGECTHLNVENFSFFAPLEP